MNSEPARRFNAWNILFFMLGLGLLAGLLTQVDLNSLFRQVTGIKPLYFLMGGLCYLLKTSLRALRFQRLNRHNNPQSPRYLDMVRLVLASSLAAQIFPLKLGEFAYVYLLKRGSGASIPQGLSSLLAARLFDLLAIALLFILVSVALGFPALDQLSIYFNAILVFIAVLLASILTILISSRSAGRLLDWIIALPLLRGLPLLGKIHTDLASLFASLARYTAREALEWGILSGLEWFVNYLAFQVLLLGIGMTPSFYATVVSVTFAALASVLPLNSFGSFGTQEAGWAAGMLLMGFPRADAISSGFAAHLLTLAYMLLLGGFSWLTYLLPQSYGRAQR